MDEFPLLERIGRAIVKVERAARRLAREVGSDYQSDGITPGEDGGTANEITAREDRTSAVEDRR